MTHLSHLHSFISVAIMCLLLAAALTCSGCSAAKIGETPDPDRPLVGVSYFAGWWPQSPNKWEAGNPRADWRPKFPDRVPLLGEFNTQETMDKEIAAAVDHGVDFFAILWYPPSTTSRDPSEWLDRGLEYFMASPNAPRMKFMVEICNHLPFPTETDEQWDRCIAMLLPAFKHPSCLRVDGRVVVKIHSAWQFWRDGGENAVKCLARIARLRNAIKNAGLGDPLIGGGGNIAPMPASDFPAKLFDFAAEYMMVPELPASSTDYPYADLAAYIRTLRTKPDAKCLPFMPVLAAGWNPRPWHDPRPCFAFPTRDEWTAELRQMNADLRASSNLGIPRRDGTVAKAFTIYAWNEFGEGGIVAPTRGEREMKIEAILDVFGPSHASRSVK